MARVLIDTSAWHYDCWRGPFFPKGLPIKSQLQFYASQFQTAELNGVFYRTPTPEAVRSWREQTGADPVSTSAQFSRRRRPARIVFQIAFEKRRYSFEFLHPSWYAPRILRLLSEQNISLCLSDHHDAPAPRKRTADFVYVRGHAPGGRYKGRYRSDVLADWGRRLRSWKKQGCDVFVHFDNDQKSTALADALKLRQLLES